MSNPAWARRSKGMSFLYRITLFFAWLFYKVCYRTRVYGEERFPEGGAILASNHVSFLDPPLIAISSPVEVHFLARESLFKNPLFGGFIRALNAHPVSGDVGDVSIFKLITQLLTQGKKVILFPEGARSFDNQLGEIKPGIALLVSRSNSAVVPTYLHGTFEAWSRARSSPKFWGKTACVFGTPIYWKDFAHLDKKEAQKALADRLSQSILALRTWYESGAKGTPP
jgi:1-acyl-sn-glycerol-3-phosphate acyltransferase